MLVCYCIETLGDVTNRFIPRSRNQLAALLVTNQRRANTRFVVDERVSKTSFNAKELTVDAVDVTIARDHAHQLAATRTERHLTPSRTEVARRDRLGQLPRARLVTISRIQQRAGRAHLDAVAALRTI